MSKEQKAQEAHKKALEYLDQVVNVPKAQKTKGPLGKKKPHKYVVG